MSSKNTLENGSDSLISRIESMSLNSIQNAISQSTRGTAVELYKTLESSSDWLRADYSAAINLLEANDEWFAARVSSHIKEAYSTDTSTLDQTKKESLKTADLTSLSLVSKDEFEDWLTANVAVKYLEAELAYELNEVRLILGFLKEVPFDTKNCPLSPNTIFRCLKNSIETLDIPTTPQAIIYKLFSRQLLSPLRDLYKSIIIVAQKEQLHYKPLIPPSRPASEQNISEEGWADNQLVESVDESGSDVVDESVSNLDHGQVSQGIAGQHSSSGMSSSGQAPIGGGQTQRGHVNQQPSINMLGQESNSRHASSAQSVVKSQHTETLSTLSKLNTRVSSGGSLSQTGQGQLSEDSAYLISAISQLQQAHIQTDNLGDKKLRAWLESGLTDCPDVKCNIGHQESQLIDVTDRFFEVVIDKVGVSGLLENG